MGVATTRDPNYLWHRASKPGQKVDPQDGLFGTLTCYALTLIYAGVWIGPKRSSPNVLTLHPTSYTSAVV